MNYAQNAGYGLVDLIRLNLNLPVMGKLLVVCPTTDPNYDRLADIVKTDPDGVVRLYATVAAAYAAATTNAHDVIALSANSSHPMTEMLTVAKNRVHFIGMDGGGRQTGHGARMVMGVTTAATDIAVVKVTGVRCSFRNIKIESSNTIAQSLYALVDAGEYSCYENCSFLKLTDLGEATAADVVLGGDSTTWRNCEFGAATLKATAARPICLIDKSVAGSNGMMDNNFFDCNFVSFTSSADRRFIKLVANQDGQRYTMFRGCSFINWDIHADCTTMTNAIFSVSGQAQLYMVFDANTICVGCTNFANSDNTGVMICAPVPTAATSGIAVEAA